MTLKKTTTCSVATAWLLLACPAGAAAQEPDRCAAFGVNDARGAVCRVVAEERSFVLGLEKTPSAAGSCALVRTQVRIEQILSEVARGTGQLPVSFTVRSVGTDAQGRRELFADQPDAVVIEMLEEGTAAPPGACMAGAHRDSVLRVATAVGRAVHGYNLAFLKPGAAQLRKLANTWAWVITDGFGQYPWERAFNDLVHRGEGANIIANLPKHEWVLLHPSVGLMLSGVKQLKNSRGQTAFFLEPLGFIRYRLNVDGEKRSYWGASALVVATADQPPAVGGLLRFNKYSFGVARHLGEGSNLNGRWAVTATMELLERLQPARKGVQDAGEKAGASGARQERRAP